MTEFGWSRNAVHKAPEWRPETRARYSWAGPLSFLLLLGAGTAELMRLIGTKDH